MSGNRMIYVRKADATFFERAEAAEKKRGGTLSSLVSRLIRQSVLQAGGPAPEPTAEEMAAQIADLSQRLAARIRAES